jgi:hypothetical protein
LALVAVVRTLGTRLGEIMHTTRGGPRFREMFDPAKSGFQLSARVDLRHLLERRLLGLDLAGYPGWGGLDAAELASAAQDLQVDPVAVTPDPDYQQWLFDLQRLIVDAQDLQKDLVTLYL